MVRGIHGSHSSGQLGASENPPAGTMDTDPDFERAANALQAAMLAYNQAYASGLRGGQLDLVAMGVMKAVNDMNGYFTTHRAPTSDETLSAKIYGILNHDLPFGSTDPVTLGAACAMLGTSQVGRGLQDIETWTDGSGNGDMFADGTALYSTVNSVQNTTQESTDGIMADDVMNIRRDLSAFQSASLNGDQAGMDLWAARLAADLSTLNTYASGKTLDGFVSAVLTELNAATTRSSGQSIASLAAAYLASPSPATLSNLEAGLNLNSGEAIQAITNVIDFAKQWEKGNWNN